MLGAVRDPMPVFGGMLVVDTSRMVVLAASTQAASGVTMLSLRVPANPAFAGQGVAVQAASFSLAQQAFALSTPAVVVID